MTIVSNLEGNAIKDHQRVSSMKCPSPSLRLGTETDLLSWIRVQKTHRIILNYLPLASNEIRSYFCNLYKTAVTC